ncbi:proteinase-activated receptor 1-like isoform X1 [Rhincodon typus]|uniref:proteinase-activated receptor 1-like isoform X1 n=1 Tax=Rhincodon typus TaxID=259920 RepID=UPI0009A42C48|nr:proteinase-activated receptor 1-like isoform X1 [Rhincodon typus]
MGWTSQLVLWVALLPSISALNIGNSSQNGMRPRTFAAVRSHESLEVFDLDRKIEGEGSGLYDGSGFIDGSGFGSREDKPIIPDKIHEEHYMERVAISNTAEQYLTSQWMTAFIPSVYTLVFALGLLLNCVAILMIHFRMKFEKPAIIYMMNLASADLLFLLMLPLKIAYHFSGNDWGFGSFLCRLVTGSFYAYMYCSVLLMMCISIDRFLAVVYPIRSATWRTWGRTVVICLVVWLVAIGGTIPLFLTEQTVYVTELGITTCHDVLPLSTLQSYSIYYFPILCFLLFVIPLLVTSFCYGCIISTLQSANVTNKCKKTRAICMAVIVLSVFIVCFAPSNIILLIHYLNFYYAPSDHLYFAYMLCVCIGSVSCCLDPLIYYYGSSLFQMHFQNLLCPRYVTESENSETESKNCKTGTSSFNDSSYKKLLV